MGALLRAFNEKYPEFKRNTSNSSLPFKGFYVSDNEFPIGKGDKQQYFRSVAYQSKFNGFNLSINSNGNKLPFTLIEGYSKNDESKKRGHSKSSIKAEAKSVGGPRKQLKR